MPATTTTLPAQVSPAGVRAERAAPHELGVWRSSRYPFTSDDGTPVLGPGAEAAGDALGIDLLAVLESRQATGTGGEVVSVPVAGRGNPSLRLVLLVGLGDESRRTSVAPAPRWRGRPPTTTPVATTVAAAGDGEALTAFVVGAMLGSFVFHWRSQGPEHRPVRRIVLAGLSDETAPPTSSAVSSSAAPAGAPGCCPQCRPT